jgi:hypothetical protein
LRSRNANRKSRWTAADYEEICFLLHQFLISYQRSNTSSAQNPGPMAASIE